MEGDFIGECGISVINIKKYRRGHKRPDRGNEEKKGATRSHIVKRERGSIPGLQLSQGGVCGGAATAVIATYGKTKGTHTPTKGIKRGRSVGIGGNGSRGEEPRRKSE